VDGNLAHLKLCGAPCRGAEPQYHQNMNNKFGPYPITVILSGTSERCGPRAIGASNQWWILRGRIRSCATAYPQIANGRICTAFVAIFVADDCLVGACRTSITGCWSLADSPRIATRHHPPLAIGAPNCLLSGSCFFLNSYQIP